MRRSPREVSQRPRPVHHVLSGAPDQTPIPSWDKASATEDIRVDPAIPSMRGHLSDAAQYSYDLAEDGGVLNVASSARNRPGNRRVRRVVRNQPDLAVHSLERS